MEENLNTLTAEEPTGLERLDAYIGTVVDSCRSGIFVRLEDGQDTLVFAYHGAPPRSRVLCALAAPTATPPASATAAAWRSSRIS